MKKRNLVEFFIYLFEFLFCLAKLNKYQNVIEDIFHKKNVRNTNDSFTNICLKVSYGLIYYEDLLKNYKYDNKCLKYNKIGNYVLEKHNMSNYNCYKKIQKPLCKLNYINIENQIIEDNNINNDNSVKESAEEKNSKANTNMFDEQEKHIANGDNIYNSKIKKCYKTKNFFISLIKRCIEKGDKDPLVHCASLNFEKKIILDPKLFCESSYERKGIEEKEIRKSIYNDIYKKAVIKTFNFKNEETNDCINIVNIFNNCSIVERNIFGTTIDSCILERSKNFCHKTIEEMHNKNYIYTCSDIILPYLLSSKEENKSYNNLCHNFNNYLNILKEKKNFYLKEKRKLEEKVKTIRITQKLYKMIEDIFQLLKEETQKNSLVIDNLFHNLEKLENQRLFNEEYILKLNKVHEKLQESENLIIKSGYPVLNKNSIEENISLFKEIKANVEKLRKLQMDIGTYSKLIIEYINKKKNEKLNDKDINEINLDELKKLKKKYDNIKNFIENYSKKNNNSIYEYQNSYEKDFIEDSKNFNNLVEIYTDQIYLLIKNNIK
ncbi:conserved Plasmodium protein, unknown function [Plasmodium gallinaceum]|uniref:Reticulocyte binding protein n=1 Tax=Plasmodium gallinaceum TaxID=5849 RepID=A0A1J1GV91_PLAGA|nr:conserved Plasmodium protein, unknown function [Plasmodium gallinaceum]CRG96413.1 conserved Plasmodium protein, unknown function [Plasmodium gallinaceum]